MTCHHARAILLAVALSFASACQRGPDLPFAGRFAVELPGPGAGYVIVPDRGLASTEISGDSLRLLPGIARRASAAAAIKLDFTVEERNVITIVYSLPPASDPLRYEDGHKRFLGRHAARLNETVKLSELQSLGYQPLILRIVSAKPDHPARPVVISRVPSIRASIVEEDRIGYMLSLRNVSRRDIVSYLISRKASGGISLGLVSFGRPRIAAGGEISERIEPSSSEIVIAAALFRDGSHEGDSVAAASLKSRQIAQETQERRAMPILNRVTRDPALDETSRLAQIKGELTRLSNQPDDPGIRAMVSQFPDLPAKTIQKDLTDALYEARVNLWSEVYAYVHASGQYPPPRDPPLLSRWLRERLVEPPL